MDTQTETSWAALIRELESAGWSLKAIGDRIGLTTSSVSDLKNERSKEPRGMSAVLLHALHKEVCSSKAA